MRWQVSSETKMRADKNDLKEEECYPVEDTMKNASFTAQKWLQVS